MADTTSAVAETPKATTAVLMEQFDSIVDWAKKALEDKNTRIAVGVAAGGVAAIVAYLLFSRRSASAEEAPAAQSKSAKKAKKRKSAAAAAAAKETADHREDVSAAATAASAAAPATQTSLESAIDRASAAKSQGNELYKEKEFAAAAEAYTRGIELTPKDHPTIAILYANRAACYANLKRNEDVISDCTNALAIDPRYIKALLRRAVAYENLENHQEALYDYTLLNILEGFAKNEHLAAFDKVLRELCEVKAREIFKTRTPLMPSAFYVTAYLDGFRVHPLDQPTLGDDESAATIEGIDGDHQFRTAIHLAKKRDYDASLHMLESAIKNGTAHMRAARNLLGTYLYLRGDLDEAFGIFDELVTSDAGDVNALIKRGSVAMELSNSEAALKDMETAMALNTEPADVYYHRGNVYFLMDRSLADPQNPTAASPMLPLAIADYKKAIELNPEIPFLYVQLAVAQYRSQQVDEAMETFKTAEERFPKSADILNYHGEVLLELRQIDEATRKFDRAMKLKPTTPLAFMNKGLTLMQKDQIPRALETLKKALEVDDRCDMAHLQLAQLYQQMQQFDEALGHYDKALALGRSVNDMVQVLAYREAIKAQLHIAQRIQAAM